MPGKEVELHPTDRRKRRCSGRKEERSQMTEAGDPADGPALTSPALFLAALVPP